MFEINWQEIQEKYPKGYGFFIKEADYKITIKNFMKNNVCLEKIYCYCDLESFFDKLGIIIIIDNDYYDGYIWTFSITDSFLNYKDFSSEYCFDTRNEAKLSAVKKAFEILEKQLEGK